MTVHEQEPRAGHEVGWPSGRLWRELEAMRIGPEGAAPAFAARLARENGWTSGYAEAVVEEYKRFLFLAATGSEPVTPSDEVDQAWHLHLAYSRHYWDVLCAGILKRPLHHGPATGGEGKGSRYRRQYEATLRLYRRVFGTAPPPAIWPDPGSRFSGRSVRVDRRHYWLVPRAFPRIAGLAGAAAMVGACSLLSASGGGGDWIAGVLGALAGAGCIALTLAAVARTSRTRSGRRDRRGGCGSSCGSGGSSDNGSDAGGCGGGGCGGD